MKLRFLKFISLFFVLTSFHYTLATLADPSFPIEGIKSKGRSGRIFKELHPQYQETYAAIIALKNAHMSNGEVAKLFNDYIVFGAAFKELANKKHPGISKRRAIEKAYKKLKKRLEDLQALINREDAAAAANTPDDSPGTDQDETPPGDGGPGAR